MMEAGLSARLAARQLGPSVLRRDVGTSGSERCHLNEDQAWDALERPVVKKTATSKNVPEISSFLDSRVEMNQVRVFACNSL
ncbi:hypothetical protein TNCV_673391 [Trichonephila clavipes]|uniref:Uncharacterized protein n=1 Tax=Trichonephila clavipes TaxID=2585209 RepID=A0A8X7BJE0_TRICX|nr:hypothetical protein TNCV_673391 [Trichonephila clavipes]